MTRKLARSITYTIRVREEQMPAIEQARGKGNTMSAILLKGAEVINGEAVKPAVR